MTLPIIYLVFAVCYNLSRLILVQLFIPRQSPIGSPLLLTNRNYSYNLIYPRIQIFVPVLELEKFQVETSAKVPPLVILRERRDPRIS
jgi:hypothetical protein